MTQIIFFEGSTWSYLVPPVKSGHDSSRFNLVETWNAWQRLRDNVSNVTQPELYRACHAQFSRGLKGKSLRQPQIPPSPLRFISFLGWQPCDIVVRLVVRHVSACPDVTLRFPGLYYDLVRTCRCLLHSEKNPIEIEFLRVQSLWIANCKPKAASLRGANSLTFVMACHGRTSESSACTETVYKAVPALGLYGLIALPKDLWTNHNTCWTTWISTILYQR